MTYERVNDGEREGWVSKMSAEWNDTRLQAPTEIISVENCRIRNAEPLWTRSQSGSNHQDGMETRNNV